MTSGKRAAWYRSEACLEYAGGLADTAAGRRKDAEYLAWLAAHAPEQKRLRFDRMSKGWAVGTKEFKAALVDDHREAAAALERGEPDLAETRTARLEKRLDELLAAMGKKRGDLAVERKSAPWRVALAAEMKAGTTATNQWLADALAMGSPFQVEPAGERVPGGARSGVPVSAGHEKRTAAPSVIAAADARTGLRPRPRSSVGACSNCSESPSTRTSAAGGRASGGCAFASRMFWTCWRTGESEQTILEDFPDLEAGDIRACLEYAATQVDHAVLSLAK
ncbi:MAG: hypothetical protein RL077_2770 [Verrucomicrobiota bacterium]|jgi:hypothetical protein